MQTITRIACGALLGLTLVACHKEEEAPVAAAPVQVAAVTVGSIRHVVTADAVLFPRNQATITPRINAPVRRFLVNRGDHVKAGQLLAELENSDLTAAALESKGQMALAESNYRSTTGAIVPEQLIKAQSDRDAARAGLDAAQKLLESRQQLFKEGATARKTVDEAQVAYAQAKSQFDAADQHLTSLQQVGKQEQVSSAAAQVDAAKGHYESAQAQLVYSQLRSPIDGVVTDRPLYPGEMATPGTPAVTVMDVSALVARVNLPQQQATDIKKGAEATITPADGGEPLTGNVTIVSPATDMNSTTVQIWVQVDNPKERLRAGQSVHVEIVASTMAEATLIPASAVLPSDEGGTMALVVDDHNVAHQKPIKVGVREGEMAQVLEGVAVGERVVTVGGLGLADKSEVRVVKPEDEKAAGAGEAGDRK